MVVLIALLLSASLDASAQTEITQMSNRVREISAGLTHTCALRVDGSVICWPEEVMGAISRPTSELLETISSGGIHTCGLRDDGRAVCWVLDSAEYMDVGVQDIVGQIAAPEDELFVMISSGGFHTCALRSDGSALCWGVIDSEFDAGQTMVPVDEQLVAISSGLFHTCGLRGDGSALCWGAIGSESDFGQTIVPEGERLIAISSGGVHTCGLRNDRSVVCWGANDPNVDLGQAKPPTGDRFASIASGATHTCGLRADGTAVCWGGQYPDDYGTPESVRFVSIDSGGKHTCGVRGDGRVRCWGEDEFGQLTPPPSVDVGPLPDDHSDERSGATLLTESASGRIAPGDDVDYFRFDITKPAEVAVFSTSSGYVDLFGRLEMETTGGRIEEVASDDDGGEGFNFRIQSTLLVGTYYLAVTSYGETGNYMVHVEMKPLITGDSESLSSGGRGTWCVKTRR